MRPIGIAMAIMAGFILGVRVGMALARWGDKRRLAQKKKG